MAHVYLPRRAIRLRMMASIVTPPIQTTAKGIRRSSDFANDSFALLDARLREIMPRRGGLK
jgi:hypothetical protein